MPAPIARDGPPLCPSLVPTLIRRRDLIEASRRRTPDLSMLLARRCSFRIPGVTGGGPVHPDMINGTPVDVVAEFPPTFDKA